MRPDNEEMQATTNLKITTTVLLNCIEYGKHCIADIKCSTCHA